jgi:uncharacterized lipoprotein YddW (UPF0748 family)
MKKNMKNRSIKSLITATILISTVMLNLTSCKQSETKEETYKWDRNWMWMYANMKRSDAKWDSIFTRFEDNGITGILIGGGVPMLEKVIPLAEKHGIDVHAWMWTLNRPGDKEAKKHPEWYAVSGKGESCFDVHPYVDYYQWLCPSQEAVYQHIAKQVRELAQVKGLKGIHLDYVRYPDVILAKALQPKYNLVQDREYPEFDFCYCDTCKAKFKEETGIDIGEVEDPTAVEEWRQYRYNSVTRLVNRLVEVAHGSDKLISAAVFPYPDLAREICRQSWDDWNLDCFFPMVYQNFYDEDMEWIKTATSRGVHDLNGKAALVTGLYLPKIPDGKFSTAVENAFKGGAGGVAIFDEGKISDEELNTILEVSKKFKSEEK